MLPNSNLRQRILTVAGELFAQQGYSQTSNKQIAKAAGCTSAALYYYFEDGKTQILREVIRSYSASLYEMIRIDSSSTTLNEALGKLLISAAQVMPDMLRKLNWLLVAFPTLPSDEQHYLQTLLLDFHRLLNEGLGRYTANSDEAQKLAWLIFCAFFGYEQLFLTLGLNQHVSMNYTDFGQTLLNLVALSKD